MAGPMAEECLDAICFPHRGLAVKRRSRMHQVLDKNSENYTVFHWAETPNLQILQANLDAFLPDFIFQYVY